MASGTGCEALCLILENERAPAAPWYADSEPTHAPADEKQNSEIGRGTEADIIACTQKPLAEDGVTAYVCQATQLPSATAPLPWWGLSQYIEDFTSGNVGLGRMAKSFAYTAYRHYLINLGIGIGPALRWIYDKFISLRGGTLYAQGWQPQLTRRQLPTSTIAGRMGTSEELRGNPGTCTGGT
jgi:hypothetical protein